MICTHKSRKYFKLFYIGLVSGIIADNHYCFYHILGRIKAYSY
jgi:hypothetical protein